jgi:diguanylate cyclase (GGDEF)-like protein
MPSISKGLIPYSFAIFFIVLGILVSGTWGTVKITADHLLYQNATSAAYSWARFLAASVTDLEQIAGGEQPSAASMAFLQSARKSEDVFRYEIFNRDGFAQLVSDRDRVALVDLSKHDADAARSVTGGQPIVEVKEGSSINQPAFFARAYVPIWVDGRVIAVVAAYVDETEQRADFYDAFLIASVLLCLLMGLAFAVPAVAWYRRTKEKQQADRRIRFLAHHDALTGLTNRPTLIEQLEKDLAVLPARGGCLAVHFIDFDRFKEVNDTLGHDGGDFLLKTFAKRLLAAIRINDTVARLGGDEFVVVQNGIAGKDEAESFAERLAATLTAPVIFKEHEILSTVSIGVSLAPENGNSPERLLKSADLALYKSKTDGRNCVRLFKAEMDTDLQTRINLEKLIRDAVLHDRFELHYQPLFEISDRRLIGFEALIRLPALDGTLIPPLVFIPVAEDMQLIDKVGTWVLREACRTAATWPEPLTVAVNLSPTQFSCGNVSDIVAAALKESGLQANRLELEITETVLLGNSEAVLTELQKLKAMGIAIVMDDFGTGYSSLSYLWRFPFDKIKIDRSFMQSFDGSGRDAETVVKTIIALGRELHMRVTVEGVETARQATFLDAVDGDQAQGYYFGRPVPASELSVTILADFKNRLATPSLAYPKAVKSHVGKASASARSA